MPSVLSQAVMGRERSLSPQRQTDGHIEHALCLRFPHSGESAGPRGDIRESLAGHSQPAWPEALPLPNLGLLEVLSNRVGRMGDQESGRANVRTTWTQTASA